MAGMHPFQRTELLVGGEGLERLQGARVAVIGLGGVGSYAAEALARASVGRLVLVDFDRVCVTNLNRQLHATRQTVNKPKAELMAERARAINPKIEVVGLAKFFGRDSADEILGSAPFARSPASVAGSSAASAPDSASEPTKQGDGGLEPAGPPGPEAVEPQLDYVLDCIDNMTAKVHLLQGCVRRGIPVISAMGAGGRMDPTRLRVSDISRTKIDPFARLVRDLLRQQGIASGVECVWSEEPPNELDGAAQAAFRCICPGKDENTVHGCESRHQVQGSVSWMPAMFGLTMAGVVVNRMLERPVWGSDQPRRGPQLRMSPAPDKPSRSRKKELLRASEAPEAK